MTDHHFTSEFSWNDVQWRAVTSDEGDCQFYFCPRVLAKTPTAELGTEHEGQTHSMTGDPTILLGEVQKGTAITEL